MNLSEKIQERSAIIGVIGLGYVGLPLALLQAKTGFQVWGIEEAQEKFEKVNTGTSYLPGVDEIELREMITAERLKATSDFSCLANCDVVLICVPTPLTPNKEPDIQAIIKVTQFLSRFLRPDMTELPH